MLDKHDLHHEFPEFEQEIRHLKMDNAHFARLFKDYHQINQEVHRIEVGAEVTSDDYLETKKIARLHLKDELFSMLKKAKETA